MDNKIKHNWKLVYEDEEQVQYIDINNIEYEKDSANFVYIWRRSVFLEGGDSFKAFDSYCHIDWGNYMQKSIKFIFYDDTECKDISDELEDHNSEYEKYEEGSITYDVIKFIQKHQVLKFIQSGELRNE